MEIDQVLIGRGLRLRVFGRGERFRRDGLEGAVEVVDRLDEVFGESLDGELAGGVDVANGSVLEVTEVGDGAEVFVLKTGCVNTRSKVLMGGAVAGEKVSQATYLQIDNLAILRLKLLFLRILLFCFVRHRLPRWRSAIFWFLLRIRGQPSPKRSWRQFSGA